MTAATTTPRSLQASDLLEIVCDPGTFRSWDSAPAARQHSESYQHELQRARERSGVDESILTGEGLIRGRRVAVVVSEFSFLGGSIGVDAADRLVRAIERATAERLPLLAGPASGGTRMQEGTLAFLSMVKISAAIARHKAEGLPYLVYLRNPTTGGVMASWASLGHVTVAEPRALLGFLGPRVFEALHGSAFPADVQTSENLLGHGLIDAIVAPRQLAGIVDRVLDLVQTPQRADAVADEPAASVDPDRAIDSAWDSIRRSRRDGRPGVRTLLRLAAEEVLPLSGTGQGERDPGLMLALVRLRGQSCVVIGQDRGAQRSTGPLGPGALREARRGMRLAQDLDLPLVSIIDTPGAAMSRQAEEGGLSGEIARCLAELVMCPIPTISVLLGEGTGGGALALLPADRTVAAEHGWLSPLPPEGASAILFRDTSHAAELATEQGVSSRALLANGIVDTIVPEYPDAADEPEAFCERVGAAIALNLIELRSQRTNDRFAARQRRYRNLGALS